MPTITVLGNFSGRNAGDNAILGNLLDDIAQQYADVEFLVPTLNPHYVRSACRGHRVRALGLMPWHGALKIFGVSTLYAMLRADLVLITDNLLFDRRFFNPAFNYLSTIALLAPLCRRRRIPVVPYNASLGPIHTPRGIRALQRVLDASPFVIVRDRASRELISELGLRSPPVVVGADCALNTTPSDAARIDEILRQCGIQRSGRPWVGFNVNSYIDSWHRDGARFERGRFVATMAGAVDAIIESLDIDPLFFISQVMDTGITREIQQRMRHRQRVRTIANPAHDYRDMAGIMSRLELVVAMRTHAMILATSVGTPVVNINAYPKSINYLETIGLQDWTIAVAKLSSESLQRFVTDAWHARALTRAAMVPMIAREKSKARASVRHLADIAPLRLRVPAGALT